VATGAARGAAEEVEERKRRKRGGEDDDRKVCTCWKLEEDDIGRERECCWDCRRSASSDTVVDVGMPQDVLGGRAEVSMD